MGVQGRVALWILFIFSVIIMIIDLVLYLGPVGYFYAFTNACLLFRLLGVFWLTSLLHILLFALAAFIFLLQNQHQQVANLIIYSLPLALLLVLSLHLVLFRPGKSLGERACRVGLHALTGLIVIVIYFWLICFFVQAFFINCLLEMIYMLLFLIMLLTPHYLTNSQAVMIAQRACQAQRRRSASGTRSSSRSGRDHRATSCPRGRPRSRSHGSVSWCGSVSNEHKNCPCSR